MEDEAVEWSETISLSLSQLGTSDTALNVSEKPVLIDITDDDGKRALAIILLVLNFTLQWRLLKWRQ